MPILDHGISEVGYMGSEGHLGTTGTGVWEGHSEGHSELILDPILDPILRNLIKQLKSLHTAVGRALRLNIAQYGSLEGPGWVPV